MLCIICLNQSKKLNVRLYILLQEQIKNVEKLETEIYIIV